MRYKENPQRQCYKEVYKEVYSDGPCFTGIMCHNTSDMMLVLLQLWSCGRACPTNVFSFVKLFIRSFTLNDVTCLAYSLKAIVTILVNANDDVGVNTHSTRCAQCSGLILYYSASR